MVHRTSTIGAASTETKFLRILIIEDSDDDAQLVLRELRRLGYSVEHQRIETAGELRSTLAAGSWALVLCDYSLPHLDAPQALEIVNSAGLDLPFIIISGTIGEESAVSALKAGAHDFIIKGKYARLGPAIERELGDAKVRQQRRQAEIALREKEELLSEAQRIGRIGSWSYDIPSGSVQFSDEMYRLLEKNKNNPLLVGLPGVGKTALVLKLAQLIAQQNVPCFLMDKKIMSLDVAALIAGTSFRGEFELRLKEILKEISSQNDVMLFIDEIHNIVGAGNIAGSLDLANIIKPALTQGEIRLIGATTYKEYKQHIEKDAALARRFQPVEIQEPTREETRKILLGIKNDYEKFHSIIIGDEALRLSVDLSCRYIQERHLPDKALDVLDEAAAFARTREKPTSDWQKLRKLRTTKNEIAAQKERSIAEENYEEEIELRRKEKKLEEDIRMIEKTENSFYRKTKPEIHSEDIIDTVARMTCMAVEKIAMKSSQNMAAIGIRITVETIPAREFFNPGGVLEQGNFDLAELAWTGGTDNEPYLTEYLSTSSSTSNVGGYSNPSFDAAIANARAESSDAGKLPFLYEAQGILTHDLPVFPLFTRFDVAPVATDRGTDVTVSPEAYLDITFGEVTDGGVTTDLPLDINPSDLPPNFQLLGQVYDIGTSASFISAKVCFSYDDTSLTPAQAQKICPNSLLKCQPLSAFSTGVT